MRRALPLVVSLLMAASVLFVLQRPLAGIAPLGDLLDPLDGLYRTARRTVVPADQTLVLPFLDGPVTVERDDRGVPHIFASTDRDAIRAMGYVVAQDRLFQLDFIARAGSGRLAEALGPAAVDADRFLRSIGMDWGARKNADRIRREAGAEWDITSWYAEGVNAYLDALPDGDLPFEFRLLGFRPARYTPLHAMRLLQYMVYDLTFANDGAAYGFARSQMSPADFDLLYPRFARLFVPIIPAAGGGAVPGGLKGGDAPASSHLSAAGSALERMTGQQKRLRGTALEGFVPGKGSNNWAVAGSRSATGAPILAGDMHLSLSLPAIWYEVHLVTPEMNTYGVTIPGAPLPIEAFNDYLGWTFTNTGTDQIDHLGLDLDVTRTRYRYEGGYRDLEQVLDTVYVRGAAPVVDTLTYAHWGPVVFGTDGAVALRWVAHEPNRTLAALWGMNHARTYTAFEAALRQWDAPMQNILYADAQDTIAIRSTGLLPIRRNGQGAGLLDGASDAYAWTGRVPFEALPHAVNPSQGFLTSTNQQPTDSTYAYYLGHDWNDGYRSLRIDALLRGKAAHSVEDLKRYQADVKAVQRDLFVPLLDTLAGLGARADTLRRMLAAWDGVTERGRPEPLILDTFLRTLRRLAWDEPVFGRAPQPEDAQLLRLLMERPASPWLDVQRTPQREGAQVLLRTALDTTAAVLERQYGWDAARWTWGDHHAVVFRHLTRSEALRPLWRGPYPFPGFDATLSPAGGRPTTHSASWRVVVDFSPSPPLGYGVYPGGQSGDPLSPLYDLHVPAYLAFSHYPLLKPEVPGTLNEDQRRSRLVLRPPQPR